MLHDKVPVDFYPVNTEVYNHPHLYTNDEIFRDANDSFNITEANIDYKDKDYAMYIYNTSNADIYTLYSNNLLTMVKKKPILRNYQFTNTGDRDYLTKGGLTIIEYFSIRTNTVKGVDVLLKHYIQNKFNNIDDKKLTIIYEEVVNKLNPESPLTNITLRLVTHIPIVTIIKNKYSYLSKYNLCLIHKPDIYEEPIYHPASKESHDADIYKELLKGDFTNSLHLELIDNDNPNTPFYFKLFNNTVEIYSKRSATKSNGIRYRFLDKDLTLNEGSAKLDELENIHIYKTKKDAEINGDIKSKIERDKLNLESEKIRLGYRQILLEEKKILGDLEKIYINNSLEKTKAISIINKLELEKEMSDAKTFNNSLTTLSTFLTTFGKIVNIFN